MKTMGGFPYEILLYYCRKEIIVRYKKSVLVKG